MKRIDRKDKNPVMVSLRYRFREGEDIDFEVFSNVAELGQLYEFCKTLDVEPSIILQMMWDMHHQMMYEFNSGKLPPFLHDSIKHNIRLVEEHYGKNQRVCVHCDLCGAHCHTNVPFDKDQVLVCDLCERSLRKDNTEEEFQEKMTALWNAKNKVGKERVNEKKRQAN